MICYKDRTWCTFGLLCRNSTDCDRVLTEEVKQDAIRWWGDKSAPICVYQSFPDCFKAFFEED